jgi:hypothetical protein
LSVVDDDALQAAPLASAMAPSAANVTSLAIVVTATP